ncbi:hypothetical protein cce_4990 [Crocosphaera subtropica ATCC 51142]|uniref:TrbI/VirB10 family protein n=1 Tax=Crocosphaera subtropica (strain ATCC 51142 / BH68) TaxID=43989 RepID=B1X2H5_CROS5|nr:hypothetical protein [Crocosphaera subtropica]ACB54336.1 hypothetical protein cce_4990 [Crocosphaera subtropica ATCC 51142]
MADHIQQIRDTLGLDNQSAHQNPDDNLLDSNGETLRATESDVPLDPELEEDFQRHFTQHTFASHPLSKLVFVGLGSAVAVGTLVAIYSLTQTPQESANFDSISSEEKSEELFGGNQTEGEDEKDELLAQLALAEQKQRMERLNRNQPQTTEPDVSNPESVEKEETPGKPKPATKQVVVRRQPPTSTTQPVRRTQTVARRQTVPRRVERPTTHTQPKSQPKTNTQTIRSTPPEKKIDSDKRWEELAQVGSFKASGRAEPIEQIDYAQEDDGVLVASSNGMVGASATLTTQSVKARIEGGIATVARSRSEANTVAMTLLEPLVGTDGEILIPEGATVIAEATFNDLVVSLNVTNIAFEGEDDYQDITLNGNTIRVTGEQGPVIAQRREISEDEGLNWGAIGQMATAIGGLGGIEGAAELSLLMNAANGGGRRRVSRPIEMYIVEDGTEVMVRVVKPTPIPIASDNHTPDQQKEVPEFDFDY